MRYDYINVFLRKINSTAMRNHFLRELVLKTLELLKFINYEFTRVAWGVKGRHIRLNWGAKAFQPLQQVPHCRHA